jgi:hypothetical protein
MHEMGTKLQDFGATCKQRLHSAQSNGGYHPIATAADLDNAERTLDQLGRIIREMRNTVPEGSQTPDRPQPHHMNNGYPQEYMRRYSDEGRQPDSKKQRRQVC